MIWIDMHWFGAILVSAPVQESASKILRGGKGESMTDLDFAKEVMPLYIESAKSYAQLSAAALALTIIFKEKVMGESGRMRVNILMVSSWFFFLLSIGASAYYQWVAIRLIEHYRNLAAGYDGLYFPLTIWWLWPAYAYGLMVFCFFAGATLLMLTSAEQLFSGSTRKRS